MKQQFLSPHPALKCAQATPTRTPLSLDASHAPRELSRSAREMLQTMILLTIVFLRALLEATGKRQLGASVLSASLGFTALFLA